MDDLVSRDAPLEYWFWKANTAIGGAIVDFIVRGRPGDAELRVSTWDPGVRAVVHHRSASWATDLRGIRIDDASFDARGSRGAVEGVRWDLEWDIGEARFAPRPAWFGPLHPFDMELIIRPGATIRGQLTIGDLTIVMDGPGGVAHYWGRRLPSRWTWISASRFDDDPDGRLEAILVASRLWGHRPEIPAGYLWLRTASGAEGTLMPLTGVITMDLEESRVRMRSLRADGRRHTLESEAADSSFNDAGEGIRQSLLADLVLDGHLRATASAGLEFRASSG